MIKIKSIQKSKLLQEEIYQLCDMVCQKIFEKDPVKLRINSEYLSLKRSVSDMDNSLHKLPKGIYNKKVSATKRDMKDFIENFFYQVNNYKDHQDPKKIAAKALLNNLYLQYKKHKYYDLVDIVKYNTILLQNLKSEKYASAISLLKLDDRVNALDTMIIMANQLLSKRMKDDGLNKRLRNASIVCSEMKYNYNKLVKNLNALAAVYDSKEYEDLIEWWNSYLDELLEQVKVRVIKRLAKALDTADSEADDMDKPIIESLDLNNPDHSDADR